MVVETSRDTENGLAGSVVELQPLPATVVKDTVSTQANLNPDIQDGAAYGDIHVQMPPPATAVNALERWNSPKKNRWRLLATFSSVFTHPFPRSKEFRF
jgi:hypothetical protein